MSLIKNLNNQNLFTQSEIMVVDFIKNNPDLIVNTSINELAKETFSSRTSIIRICKKLGFKGFKDFKIEYTRNIEALKYLNRQIDYSFPFKEDESTLQILNSISNVYKNCIDLINSEINIQELEEIVKTLINSNHVYIFARGDTEISAHNFINKCVKIGKLFHFANQFGDQLYYAKYSNKDDCCLFITYDKNDYYYDCLREAMKKKCKIIVISAYQDNFLVKYSHYKIIIPHQESTYEKISTFYSQQSFQYILSIIYAMMYKEMIKKL